ncbi:hypothetical protein QF050_003613 [Arthrobacter sp. SLBN-112]|nr:hypothetical protein [Arthrobacter sp. SLBN-112]
MIRRVLTNNKAQPTARAVSRITRTSDVTVLVKTLITNVRSSSSRTPARIRSAQTPSVTRNAIRPSLRSPATSWALPGTSSVRRTNTNARLVRTGCDALAG